MTWISMPRRLTSTRLDVGLCFVRSTARPADVHGIPIAREASQDRSVVRWRGNGGRAAGGGGGAGTRARASGRTRPAGSADRDAVLDAGPMVTPSVSCPVPALRVAALSLSSATAQHRHGPRAEGLYRSGSVAGVLRTRPGPASLSSSGDTSRDPRGGLCRRERCARGSGVAAAELMDSSRRSGGRFNGRGLVARALARRLPLPRQEFAESIDFGAPGDDAFEHIGQIFLRVDAIEFCGVDERRQNRPCPAAL